MARMIIILFIFGLVGCTSIKDVVQQTTYIYEELDSGSLEDNIKSVNLTSGEILTINHAINEIYKFRKTYIEFLREPKSLLVFRPEDLEKDYNSLRQRFFEVEKIVANNLDKYDKATQEELIKYKEYAYELDEDINEYQREMKFISAALNSINYTFAFVKMIASLK